MNDDISTNKFIKEINEKWMLDAYQEHNSYFCYIDEVKYLQDGIKNLVIGRKGTGKTAIAQYMYNNKEAHNFTAKFSLKDFPLNRLYSANDVEFLAPNQYITIWKYIIYCSICKMMAKNESIDINVKNKLEELFGIDKKPSLKEYKKWSAKSFKLNILGISAEITGGVSSELNEVSLIETVDILEELIEEYIDESKYFILFDELDEDYKDFENDNEKRKYCDLLIGLIKASQFIFASFQKNIFPIVFLRTDIYNILHDHDKNKWSDNLIILAWNQDRIIKILACRLNILFGVKNQPFGEIWLKLFKKENVLVGKGDKKYVDIISFMINSTQLRPRDFIRYIKACAQLALERSENIISAHTVKRAASLFSEYLKAEIIDEMYAKIPEIEEILSIFSQIGKKQAFYPNLFEKAYKKLIEEYPQMKNISAEKVLFELFEASVIGNVLATPKTLIFKYMTPQAKFNPSMKIKVHRGLFKSLPIF